MNEFLNALLADLKDRRIVPFVALAGVALLAAITYTALAGGSSAAPTASSPTRTPQAPGIAVTQAKPETALAETTNGVAQQRKGNAHDPFKLLAGASKKEAGPFTSSVTTASSTSSSASGSGSSGSSESGSGAGAGSGSGSGSGEAESKPSKPTKPAKRKTIYNVAVLFGVIPPGAPPLIATLTPYEKLGLFTTLPSAKSPLIVFRGVTAGGKSATFTIAGEAILHGQARCLPNATQCQAIDLPKEHYEQFETLTPTGEVVTYELRVVSITLAKASSASLKRDMGAQSKEGRELLKSAGLLDIPLLHYSSQAGVLVFAPRGAHAARAHAAVEPPARG
jgi:hypothetical protein